MLWNKVISSNNNLQQVFAHRKVHTAHVMSMHDIVESHCLHSYIWERSLDGVLPSNLVKLNQKILTFVKVASRAHDTSVAPLCVSNEFILSTRNNVSTAQIDLYSKKENCLKKKQYSNICRVVCTSFALWWIVTFGIIPQLLIVKRTKNMNNLALF